MENLVHSCPSMIDYAHILRSSSSSPNFLIFESSGGTTRVAFPSGLYILCHIVFDSDVICFYLLHNFFVILHHLFLVFLCDACVFILILYVVSTSYVLMVSHHNSSLCAWLNSSSPFVLLNKMRSILSPLLVNSSPNVEFCIYKYFFILTVNTIQYNTIQHKHNTP